MDLDCIIPEAILDQLEAIGRARIRKTLRHLGATLGSRVLVTDFSAAYFDLFHEHFIHCEYYHFFGVKKIDEVSKLLSDMLVLRNSAEFVLEFEVVGNVNNPGEGSTAKRNLLPILQSLREPSPVAPDKPNEKPPTSLRPFPRYTDSEATGSDADSYQPTPSPPSTPVKPIPIPKATSTTPEAVVPSNTATSKVPSPAAVIQSIFTRPVAVKLETKHKMGPFIEHEERRIRVSVMMHRVMTENGKTPSHGLTKVYEAHKEKYPKAPPEEIEVVPVALEEANTVPAQPSMPSQTVPAKRVSDSESSASRTSKRARGIKSPPPTASAIPKHRDSAPSGRVIAKEAFKDGSGSYSSDSSSLSKPPSTTLAAPKQRQPAPLPRESVKSASKGAHGSTSSSSAISSPPPTIHVPPIQRQPLPSQREALEAARSASAFGLTSSGLPSILSPPPRVPSVHRDPAPLPREAAKSPFRNTSGSTSSGFSSISSPPPIKPRPTVPTSASTRNSTVNSSGRSSPLFELDPIELPPPPKPKRNISPRALNKPNKRTSSELGGPPLRPAFCRDAGFQGLQEKKTNSERFSEPEPIRQVAKRPIPPMPSMTPASSSSSVSVPTHPNTKKKQLYTVSAHNGEAEYTSDSD
uniref:WH2 domain-containing protein n=1 Tax=Panagrellus redivivus TaxID=6233 RepID=A0A7E4ZQT2_PANRE